MHPPSPGASEASPGVSHARYQSRTCTPHTQSLASWDHLLAIGPETLPRSRITRSQQSAIDDGPAFDHEGSMIAPQRPLAYISPGGIAGERRQNQALFRDEVARIQPRP